MINAISLNDLLYNSLYYFFMSRLLDARKALGFTQKAMAEILQIGQNTYSMIETGKIGLTERNKTILSEKLRINPRWLTDEQGEMFLEHYPHCDLPAGGPGGLALSSSSFNAGIPYYSRLLGGSQGFSFDDLKRDQPDYLINYELFNDCSFFRPVWGDSMSPRFNAGDVIACRRALNRNSILYGQAYLCIISMDGDCYETIRILRRHPDADQVILKSINPNFDQTTVPLAAILDMCLIKGRIERFM